MTTSGALVGDPTARAREARRFGRAILPEVSRTFAISIKALPGVLGDAVCTAYLLCRIADTIEDDNTTNPARRAEWLEAFLRTLDDAAAADAFPAQVATLQGDPAHLRLVAHTDLVLAGFRALPRLWTTCQTFGEALQTVNILKDIAHDAEHENSIYLPATDLEAAGSGHATLLSPAHLERNHQVVEGFIALARRDLDAALEYTLAIPRRAVRVRAFCVLPLLFAYATLRDLSRSRAMLTVGGQVKISRREVKALMITGLLAIVSNAALRRLVARVQAQPFTLLAVG